MQRFDTHKLKSAMIDAAILRAESMTKDDDAPVTVHSFYRLEWERTVRELRLRQRRQKRNTRILAFIIAAAVAALAGCAWTYREKIADFWVTVFEKYSVLESSNFDKEPFKMIEEVYFPTYILEGYEMVYCQVDSFKVRAKWEKDGNYLIYTQAVIWENKNALDNERSEYIAKQVDKYTVFCHFRNGNSYYTWLNEYKFCLISSKEIYNEDLKKIIENIEKIEEIEEIEENAP